MSGHVTPMQASGWLRQTRDRERPSWLDTHDEPTLRRIAEITRTRLRGITIIVVGHVRTFAVRDGELSPFPLVRAPEHPYIGEDDPL